MLHSIAKAPILYIGYILLSIHLSAEPWTKTNFIDALATTESDRVNIIYSGYLMTKFNRDDPDTKSLPRFQVKSIRAPLSYSNEWQAQMFSFHPSKGFNHW